MIVLRVRPTIRVLAQIYIFRQKNNDEAVSQWKTNDLVVKQVQSGFTYSVLGKPVMLVGHVILW